MGSRVVLQSRLSSTRLPAKALLSVRGTPLVVLAAQRAANTGLDVVVATSDHPDDDVLAATVATGGIRVVRGALEDPLSRFVVATGDMAPDDVVVRFTADNVVPDGDLAALLVDQVDPTRPYVRIGGSTDRSLPYGLAGEAFLVSALREAADQAREPDDREHVTPWIRAHHPEHVLDADDLVAPWGAIRCTVDTYDDFVRVGRLFATVDDPVGVGWRELLDRLVEQEGSPTSWQGDTQLVLGTVQIGLDYGIANTAGAMTEAAAHELLRAAAQLGLTELDTARAYGTSEDRIGSALRRGLSEHLQVVTKVRPLDDLDGESSVLLGQTATRVSVLESLRSLQGARVQALLVHRARDWHRPGVRAELARWQHSGVVERIGASIGTPEELLDLLEDPEIGHIQLPFNLLDHRWLEPPVLEEMAARPEVHIAVRSVLLQGLLPLDDPARWPRNLEHSWREIHTALDRLRRDLGRESVLDLAVNYVLGHPWVDSVVMGAQTPAQLEELVRLSALAPLTSAEQETVRQTLPRVGPVTLDPSRWESP